MPQKFSYEYNPRTAEREALRQRNIAKLASRHSTSVCGNVLTA